MKLEKTGYIEPVIKAEDFILGGNNVPKEILQENGQWLDFLPPGEVQEKKGIDMYNCTSFGTNNAIEIIFKRKFFLDINNSDRHPGISAGTYPPGNDPNVVIETIRTTAGWIPEEMLPFIEGMTVDEYFDKKAQTVAIKNKGKEALKSYYLRHEWVVTPDMQPDFVPMALMENLKYSPIPLAVSAWQKAGDKYVRFGSDNHWTLMVGYVLNEYWWIFDSYPDENGSYLKKLDWKFGFKHAKRIYIGAQDEPVQKQNKWAYWLEVINLALFALTEKIMNLQPKKLEPITEPASQPNPAPIDPPVVTPEVKTGPTVQEFAKAIQRHEGWFVGSRSYRNCNPGNLKASPFVRDTLYCIGSDDKNFAIWKTESDGMAALVKFLIYAIEDKLRSYDPEMSLYDFFSVYAPSSDHNNPLEYASAVAKAIGATTKTKIKEIKI